MKYKGFTLVEIAIVLVIIGLLLGGVLKGQELINNAKIRSIADRQNSFKVAWFAFIDRYGALPGDYAEAVRNIPQAVNGDGDGIILETDSPMLFQHLTAAGYLRCPVCTSTSTSTTADASNSPQNTYGGIISIWHNSTDYAIRGGPQSRRRLQIHTGPRMPSNIVREVDAKIDDGRANSGDMVYNNYDPTAAQDPDDTRCTTVTPEAATDDGTIATASDLYYRSPLSAPPVENNCGGSIFI